jgi:alpha-glucosidase
MVGADVCSFTMHTTENVCGLWAQLGAFCPFYRNHNSIDDISQEFYRWPFVVKAARIAINARYRILDHIYTATYQKTVDGTPLLNPMWYLYPKDAATLPIDLQYFYGPYVLVPPVTEENSASESLYLDERENRVADRNYSD